jgi:C_GCAxxG_C_C family probable redox protein
VKHEQNQEKLDQIEREAQNNEVIYWGCSQAVLDTLQRHFNIGNKEVFKAASGLAGGVGAKQEACGALVGCVMAIGLMFGREEYKKGTIARESHEFLEAQVRAGKFCDRFKDKFGGLRCGDVRANVLGEEFREFTKLDTVKALMDHDRCGEITGAAARMAAEIMMEPEELFRADIDALMAEVAPARKLQKEEDPSR